MIYVLFYFVIVTFSHFFRALFFSKDVYAFTCMLFRKIQARINIFIFFLQRSNKSLTHDGTSHQIDQETLFVLVAFNVFRAGSAVFHAPEI